MSVNLSALCRLASALILAGDIGAQVLPRPELFNHGRTRSFRAVSQTGDGLQLFVTTRGPDRNASSAFRDHVGMSRYENGRWSEPARLRFFDHETSDRDPVVTPDGRRLYFSSTAAAGGAREESGFRVWYVERTRAGWSAPIIAAALNRRAETSVTAITTAGTIYLVAGDSGAPASFDIYRSEARANELTAPTLVSTWNSAAGEAWVAVDPSGEFAVITRSPSIDSLELLLSTRDGTTGAWAPPIALRFDGANWLRPYDYRFPTISHDRSTLVLTSATRLFHLPTRELLVQQSGVRAIAGLPPMRVRPVPRLTANEPEVFFPVDLRTTNGIAFTADNNTVYLSQYTDTRNARGRRSIHILESHRTTRGWSVPRRVVFGEADTSRVPQEYHPVLSPDGRMVYFNSLRQPDGRMGLTNDVWRARRTATGTLGAAEHVREIASPAFDNYVGITRDGSVYFLSDRSGDGDIYVSRMVDGMLQPPAPVTALNSTDTENDVTVDPDERFIIFNRFIPRTTEIDLFISVRARDGTWSPPRLLGLVNTVVDWELTPTLSPDGQHLYVEVSGALVRWHVDALLTAGERAIIGAPR